MRKKTEKRSDINQISITRGGKLIYLQVDSEVDDYASEVAITDADGTRQTSTTTRVSSRDSLS